MEGGIVIHSCSVLPFSNWWQPVTVICSYVLCILCLPTLHPLLTSPVLYTHPCILFTKASNFLPFHDPSIVSIHLWIFFFSFWKFPDSFPSFRLISDCFPSPIKSAVSETDFSKMLCSLHICPTWTWKNVAWLLDILRNHPVTVKAADLQTIVHSHCPHTMIFWVVSQFRSYLQFPTLC